MGNCQAVEAATVVIEHPGGRVERAYWALTATQVMAANPGHYVAVIITSTPNHNHNKAATPVKHLKLLRPDDTLHVGYIYRLVSFEEVLKEFGSKKHVKLSRLLVKQKGKRRERRAGGGGRRRRGGDGDGDLDPQSSPQMVVEQQEQQEEMQGFGSIGGPGGRAVLKHGQWRPTLQSIAEDGS